MCGIAGIVSQNTDTMKRCVSNMVDALKHRGPDGSGIYAANGCVLGHTRLSIIDLNTGHQPMKSAASDTVITFNGEIYGYKAIKNAFSNYKFQTSSDTEVLLALYEKYADSMCNNATGMFSFAIWDNNKQELFCARDRFGEKPFYYAFGQNGEFIFASEIKGILASGLVKPVLDLHSLGHYLQKLYVPYNKSIYKNIFVLPPAHILKYTAGKLQIQKYWTLPAVNYSVTAEDAAMELDRLLRAAVNKQMVADVKVGTFLSGGLDSSTITALATNSTNSLTTISFGFDGIDNELPYADMVSSEYKTNHIRIDDLTINVAELLLQMPRIYDEPFADSSNIPTYLISQEGRKYLKVILTGDGGDELLGGYDLWYSPLFFMSKYRQKNSGKSFVYRCIANAFFRAGLSEYFKTFGHKSNGLRLRQTFESIAAAHVAQNTWISNNELNELGLLDYSHNTTLIPERNPDTLDYAFAADVSDYMPGDILVKIDRASMANGLELRAPFLDVDVANFCLSLPHTLKISSSQNKILLHHAFSKLWPNQIRKRAKRGFGAPVKKWLNRPDVNELKHAYLSDRSKKMFDLLSFEKAKKIACMNNYKTWILLVLSIWLEQSQCIIE